MTITIYILEIISTCKLKDIVTAQCILFD